MLCGINRPILFVKKWAFSFLNLLKENAMKDDNSKHIDFLENLSYILECAATESINQAETELENLCSRLETDHSLQFASWRDVHEELTEALMTYRTGEFLRAASILSGISRRVWKLLREKAA